MNQKRSSLIIGVFSFFMLIAFTTNHAKAQNLPQLSPTETLSLMEEYNFSTARNTANLMDWNAANVRNFAYQDGKLYMVYDHSDIKVVKSQTGEYLYDLDKTGINGGYYILCDVGVFDGKVIACNLKTTNLSTPLKVYVWEDDEAEPEVLLSTSNYGGATRIGDCMGFMGTWESGKLTFAQDDNTTTRIVEYTITNGVCNPTPTVVNATTNNGRRRLTTGISTRVHPDEDGYWINGQSNALTRLGTDGKASYTVPESNIFGNDFSPFQYQGKQYALLSTYLGSSALQDGAMNLVDASAGWQNVTVLDTYPSTGLGSANNSNGTGGVISNVGEDYVEAWVLSTTQGLAYYTHGTPPDSYDGTPPEQKPNLRISPTTLNFGDLKKDEEKTLNLTVTAQLIDGDISLSSNSSAFILNPTSLPSDGGVVSVTFKPTEIKTYIGAITVSATGVSNKTVALNGVGKSTETQEPNPDDTLQREFRANWVATVGNIDWPKTKITNGSTSQINAQKNELISILDKMQAANMNAVFLQIRPMSDALYETEITTWSAYLTGTRGTNPGYDPLRFAIDESHKRGMELHGWMNPYRYTNNSTTHPSTDYMYVQHPDWILDFGSNGKILNPGLPEVRTHIADVTKEILVKYPDIDGIVWDDYFYISAIRTGNQDNASFLAHNSEGLDVNDWRRSNVNKTVQEVYDSIQSVNSGVRFGISPRGIWGVSQADANQYDVKLPSGISGADNYNEIYCDGMAWLSQGTIDYISPQLYWATYPTGSSKQDYNVLCPWWQSVADKFGRHFYSSMGLYRSFDTDEIGREMDANRAASTKSPGAVFYNTTSFVSTSLQYDVYLKNNYFQTPILPPVIDWKEGSEAPQRVSNVVLEGSTLTWESNLTDGSFAIFAVPKEKGAIEIQNCEYMIHRHWTSDNSFSLGSFASLANTHYFAVGAVNRFEAMAQPKFEEVVSTGVRPASQPNYKVFVDDAGINIQVESPKSIRVYSVSGVPVYQGVINESIALELPKGVYIIQIDNDRVKLMR